MFHQLNLNDSNQQQARNVGWSIANLLEAKWHNHKIQIAKNNYEIHNLSCEAIHAKPGECTEDRRQLISDRIDLLMNHNNAIRDYEVAIKRKLAELSEFLLSPYEDPLQVSNISNKRWGKPKK